MIKNDSIPDIVLRLIFDNPLTYRELKRKALYPTLPRFRAKQSKNIVSSEYLSVVLARLKKQNLITRDERSGLLKMTEHGVKTFGKKATSFPKHSSSANVKKNKKCVVIFDIPEKQKSRRNWLRGELLCLEFEQLQKSVWIGPDPLPHSFFVALNEIKILEYIHIFTIEKKGSLN